MDSVVTVRESNIRRVGADALGAYAAVPIRFSVTAVLNLVLVEAGLGGFRLSEVPVREPYERDFDRTLGEDTGPRSWPADFDVAPWGIFLARCRGQPVGGVTVAWRTPAMRMLEGREDLATIWDIRVIPELRGRGLGRRLFETALDWARAQGAVQISVETQNTNVAACRFYARMGCTLGRVHRFAYVGYPDAAGEIMLVWYRDLTA